MVLRLINGGLVLALGAIEAGEARAGAGRVVAQASARAVSAGLVTIAVQRIRARRTFLEFARWSSVSGVAVAAHVLHGVPWH